jgi:hypothetical protein
LEGHVVATAEDTAHAERCLMPLVATADAAALGIGRTAHRLLCALLAVPTPGGRGVRVTGLAVDELAALVPGWNAWTARRAVEALVDADLVTVARQGRGGLKRYALSGRCSPELLHPMRTLTPGVLSSSPVPICG